MWTELWVASCGVIGFRIPVQKKNEHCWMKVCSFGYLLVPFACQPDRWLKRSQAEIKTYTGWWVTHLHTHLDDSTDSLTERTPLLSAVFDWEELKTQKKTYQWMSQIQEPKYRLLINSLSWTLSLSSLTVQESWFFLVRLQPQEPIP